MKKNIVAIVPAAGLGKRFGPGANKPFFSLLGKPLVIWSLEVFETLEEINEVIPVLKVQDMEAGVRVFEQYALSKVKKIAPGGKERQDSVYSGLRLLKDKADIVIVHDGARPLIDKNIVKTALDNLSGAEGVVLGVPVKDTIKEARNGIITGTLKRESIWAVQTPQIFHYEPLMNAYRKAIEEKYYCTDDSALVERNGGKVKIIMGSYSNLKLTTPEDIPVAELFLRERMGAGK